MQNLSGNRVASSLALCVFLVVGVLAGCDQSPPDAASVRTPGNTSSDASSNGGGGPTAATLRVYCYDTETDTLHICEVDPVKPFEVPGHASRFRCLVLTYEADAPDLVDGMSIQAVEEAGAYIGYLQRLDPDPHPGTDPLLIQDQYRRVDEDTWHSTLTPQGVEIVQASMLPDADGARPRILQPPR